MVGRSLPPTLHTCRGFLAVRTYSCEQGVRTLWPLTGLQTKKHVSTTHRSVYSVSSYAA
jgi:hypothetical protein